MIARTSSYPAFEQIQTRVQHKLGPFTRWQMRRVEPGLVERVTPLFLDTLHASFGEPGGRLAKEEGAILAEVKRLYSAEYGIPTWLIGLLIKVIVGILIDLWLAGPAERNLFSQAWFELD